MRAMQEIFCVLLSIAGVSAIYHYYDLGDGFGNFHHPPGTEDGPCISMRVRKTQKSTVPIIDTTQKMKQNTKTPNINFNTLLGDRKPTTKRPRIKVPSTARPGTNIIPNPDIYDYSKLSNSQIRKFLADVAKKATKALLQKSKKPRTILKSIKVDQGFVAGEVPTYAELTRQLENLQVIAKLQRQKAMANARKNGVSGRKRRAIQPAIEKRRAEPMPHNDLSHLFESGMHSGLCSCIDHSDVESDDYVMSPDVYRCYRGLSCACQV